MAVLEELARTERECTAHITLLIEVAEKLERWAYESRVGGWSTHQVEPQISTASDIRQHLAACRKKRESDEQDETRI